jgi:hypothetical protein
MGKNLSHKKVQYNYSTKMFTQRAKSIWTIGDPDNQRPDMRDSAVIQNNSLNMQGVLLKGVNRINELENSVTTNQHQN